MFRKALQKKSGSNILSNNFFKKRQYTSGLSIIKDPHFLETWSKFTETEKRFMALVDDHPQHPEILIYKGHSYKASGRFYNAIQCYEDAAMMDPNYNDKAETEIREINELSTKNNCP
jgi:tetratricopeptide (TPR) repeat protein